MEAHADAVHLLPQHALHSPQGFLSLTKASGLIRGAAFLRALAAPRAALALLPLPALALAAAAFGLWLTRRARQLKRARATESAGLARESRTVAGAGDNSRSPETPELQQTPEGPEASSPLAVAPRPTVPLIRNASEEDASPSGPVSAEVVASWPAPTWPLRSTSWNPPCRILCRIISGTLGGSCCPGLFAPPRWPVRIFAEPGSGAFDGPFAEATEGSACAPGAGG